MRHSRKAVMKEHYMLYMRKNILNGRYFVRNLQILVCVIAIVGLLTGAVVLAVSGNGADTVAASTNVSVKEALFGNSEEEKTIAKVTSDTETADVDDMASTVERTTTEVVTEAAKTYNDTTEQKEEQQTKKSEFDSKCIANVEETLNIRKEPSTEAEFVGSMNPGAIAIVEGTEGDWTKIKSGDVEGYVLTEYILTGESAEQYAKDYVTLLGTVLEDGVNVRTDKSTEADILTVLEKEDTVKVLEEDKTEDKKETDESVVSSMPEEKAAEKEPELKQTQDTRSADNDITWLQVMLEDGQTGYVSSDFVDVDELYEIAVSAEELERQAAEKAAAEEAARKAAEEEAARKAEAANGSNSNAGGSSGGDNSDSYKGATTTPVTATESGECIGTFTITAYCGCKKCSGGHNKTLAYGTKTVKVYKY